MKLVLNRKNSLRMKVARFTILLLLTVVVGYLSLLYVTVDVNKNFSIMFEESLILEELLVDMEAFEQHVSTYLTTKSSDSFVDYLDQREAIKSYASALDHGISQNVSHLKMTGINKMLQIYLQDAERAIGAKRARNMTQMIGANESVEATSKTIKQVIASINEEAFSQNLKRFEVLSDHLDQMMRLFIVMFIILVLLGLVFIVDISQTIAQPIERLTRYADQMAKGNYDFRVASDNTYKEAQVLTDAFSQMSESTREYIGVLEDKATTENKLRLSEVENLKMQNLLKQAELMALQSQINPHFLFNTINAGLQLAIIEDADRTAEFLDHMARMFRYNIQSLDNSVTVSDEVKNIQHYEYLIRVRFGDAIVLTYDIDEDLKSFLMPPLILQPIIENALVHGLKDSIENGQISLIVKGKDQCLIQVKDNGSGMDQAAREALVKSYQEPQTGYGTSGHTTGLGMANVYERLSAFYGVHDMIEVESDLGKGTVISIRLPLRS